MNQPLGPINYVPSFSTPAINQQYNTVPTINENEQSVDNAASENQPDSSFTTQKNIENVETLNNDSINFNQGSIPMNNQEILNQYSSNSGVSNNGPINLNQNPQFLYLMTPSGCVPMGYNSNINTPYVLSRIHHPPYDAQNLCVNYPMNNNNAVIGEGKSQPMFVGNKLVNILPESVPISGPNLTAMSESGGTYAPDNLVPANEAGSIYPSHITVEQNTIPTINSLNSIEQKTQPYLPIILNNVGVQKKTAEQAVQTSNNEEMQKTTIETGVQTTDSGETQIITVDQVAQTEISCWAFRDAKLFLVKYKRDKPVYTPFEKINVIKSGMDRNVQVNICDCDSEKFPLSNKNMHQSPMNSRHVGLDHDYERLTQSPYTTTTPHCSDHTLRKLNRDIQNINARSNNPVPILDKVIADLRVEIQQCVIPDESGNIPLQLSVIDEDINKLKKQCIILKTTSPQHIDHKNHLCETALMIAVKMAIKSGKSEAVSILLEEKADQTILDCKQLTPLHYATKKGCTTIVEKLVSADDAPEVIDKYSFDGLTPLHLAVIHNHEEILLLLINHGANLNIKDLKTGRTPYCYAELHGHLGLAAILKSFEAKTKVPDPPGYLPPEPKLPNIEISEFQPVSDITTRLFTDCSVENTPEISESGPVASGVLNYKSSNNKLRSTDHGVNAALELNPCETNSENNQLGPACKVVGKKIQTYSKKSYSKENVNKVQGLLPEERDKTCTIATESDVNVEDMEGEETHNSTYDEEESYSSQKDETSCCYSDLDSFIHSVGVFGKSNSQADLLKNQISKNNKSNGKRKGNANINRIKKKTKKV